MPLLVITGFPSSGKTRRSRQIIDEFTRRLESSSSASTGVSRRPLTSVVHISDDTLGISRSAYGSANNIANSNAGTGAAAPRKGEKEARAQFSSAIKRALARDVLVVADGMNYIKGFRYQLYCEAKALRTPSCVVHVAATQDDCRRWNEQRATPSADSVVTTALLETAETALDRNDTTSSQPEVADGSSSANGIDAAAARSPPYDTDILDNLLFRYEEPNGMTRWDSPLFTVPTTDETPPYDAIWAALVGTSSAPTALGASPAPSASAATQAATPLTVRPNAATMLRPASEQDFLHALDRETTEVISSVSTFLAANSRDDAAGASVAIPDCAEAVTLPMGIPPSVSQLQRHRRQFIALNRTLPPTSKTRVRAAFVDFLNGVFEG